MMICKMYNLFKFSSLKYIAFYYLFKIEKSYYGVNESSISIQFNQKSEKHYCWELISTGKFKVSVLVMSHNHNCILKMLTSVSYVHNNLIKYQKLIISSFLPFVHLCSQQQCCNAFLKFSFNYARQQETNSWGESQSPIFHSLN